jgi:hypothetical protein
LTEQGTVTHKGNRYDLGRLLQIAESRPLGSVSLQSLNWIIGRRTNPCGSCKHGPESWHEDRIVNADLIKANREAVSPLPCKWLFASDLYKALVSNEGEAV